MATTSPVATAETPKISVSSRVHSESPLRRLAPFAAVLSVTGLCLQLLVNAELSYLFIANRYGKNVAPIPPVLWALAGGAIAGALLCAWFFRGRYGRRIAPAGFLLSAACWWAALKVPGETSAVATAVFAGFAVGASLVAVGLCLRPTVHHGKLGLVCGLGVGAAYALAPIPTSITSGAATLVWEGFGGALLGLFASLGLRSEPYKHSGALDYQPKPLATWIAIFFLLVWLDTIGYYVIQHAGATKPPTWDSTLILYGNGFLQLCAAVLTGIALDRHQVTLSAVVGAIVLVAACLIAGGSPQNYSPAHVLYVIGVSIYATTLLYYAARSGRRWVMAAITAISIFGGVALASCLAANVRVFPLWSIGVVASLITIAMILRKWARGPDGEGVAF